MRTTTIRRTESYAEAMHRLAATARDGGCQLYQDEITGSWFATSRRNPATLHQLTALSCTCPGFLHHQRCGHLAMLLEELGYLPPVPDPAAPVRLARPVAGPVPLCEACGEPMGHVNGVTFACFGCGHVYALDWPAADVIERRLVIMSARDWEAVDWIEKMLTPGGDAVPAGADPDQCPCRDDAADALGIPGLDANSVAAVLCWIRDRQDEQDRCTVEIGLSA